MGLRFERTEDLDMRRVLDHAPKGESALRLRALLQGAEIHLSTKQANACVIHIQGRRPQIYLNPDFVEENIDNYYELFTIIFHEMSHVMVGHFITPKIELLFGDDFWKTQQGQKVKSMSEELLIKHLEHIALPDDVYHTITEKSFRHLGEPMNIFFRGTPDEEIEDPLHQVLHRRVFKTGSYSAREAAYVLRRRMESDPDYASAEPDENPWDNTQKKEENGDSTAQGDGGDEDRDADVSDDQSGTGEPSEKPASESDEDGSGGDDDQDPSGPEEGLHDHSPDGDEEEEEGEGDADQEDDVEGEDVDGGDSESTQDDEGDEDTPEESGAPSGSQSTADEEGLDELMKALADMSGNGSGERGGLSPEVERMLDEHRVSNVPEIQRAVAKVFRAPGFVNQIARVFRDASGPTVDHSIIPDLRHDKRAGARMAAGIYTPYYRKPVRESESKFTLYFDISGSQYDYIPACNDLVRRLKPYIADDGLILFSTYLKPMRLTEFMRESRAGTITNHSSGGTRFNPVIDDIVKRKLTHVAILTDNDATIHGRVGDVPRLEVMKHLTKTGHVLVILTTLAYSGAFRRYANKEVLIEHEELEDYA